MRLMQPSVSWGSPGQVLMAGLRKNSLILRCIWHLYGKAINENYVIAKPFQFFSTLLMASKPRVCCGWLPSSVPMANVDEPYNKVPY